MNTEQNKPVSPSGENDSDREITVTLISDEITRSEMGLWSCLVMSSIVDQWISSTLLAIAALWFLWNSRREAKRLLGILNMPINERTNP